MIPEHVPAPASAELLEDGLTVRLSRGGWSETFPIAQLPSRLAFYTKLAGPMSPSARFYAPTLDALEVLSAKIEGFEL